MIQSACKIIIIIAIFRLLKYPLTQTISKILSFYLLLFRSSYPSLSNGETNFRNQEYSNKLKRYKIKKLKIKFKSNRKKKNNKLKIDKK